jgi:hypothetical protein
MGDNTIGYMVTSLSAMNGLKRIIHPLVVKRVLKRIYLHQLFFFTDGITELYYIIFLVSSMVFSIPSLNFTGPDRCM